MTRRFFVAFLAPTSLVATKEMIRARLQSELGFSSQSGSPAHVTVKTPVELSLEQLDSLEEKIGELVADKEIQSFSSVLGKLQTFELPDRDEGIVYLPVEGPQVRDATRFLLSEFRLPRGEFEGNIPHITLASVTLSQLPLAYGEISTLAFPKIARFSRLSVFEKTRSKVREVFSFDLFSARTA